MWMAARAATATPLPRSTTPSTGSVPARTPSRPDWRKRARLGKKVSSDVVRPGSALEGLRQRRRAVGGDSAFLGRETARAEQAFAAATRKAGEHGIRTGRVADAHRRFSKDLARSEAKRAVDTAARGAGPEDVPATRARGDAGRERRCARTRYSRAAHVTRCKSPSRSPFSSETERYVGFHRLRPWGRPHRAPPRSERTSKPSVALSRVRRCGPLPGEAAKGGRPDRGPGRPARVAACRAGRRG